MTTDPLSQLLATPARGTSGSMLGQQMHVVDDEKHSVFQEMWKVKMTSGIQHEAQITHIYQNVVMGWISI